MTDQLVAALAELPLAERVQALNTIRAALHVASPFAAEPVDCVLWVPAEQVGANDYNPNVVAPPEMGLLRLSIAADGFTQPIVGWRDGATYTVVDGFHRHRVGREAPDVHDRLHGYLPITTINPDREGRQDRQAATVRHNRARGHHQVARMSDLVCELAKQWSDERIGKELGMDLDEVLRLRQIGGLAELFAGEEFSEAWEIQTEASNTES